MSTDICWLLGQAGPHPRAHPRGIRSHAGTLSGFNPLDPPILWEGRRTQRGFAPLHTPSGGTHEPKPRRGLIHQAHAEPDIAGRMEHSRIHLCPFRPPWPPSLGGEKRRFGGHPQTLGRDESLHPLGVPHPSARPGGWNPRNVGAQHAVPLQSFDGEG